MDEIKRITKNELYEIASIKGFNKDLLAKDYVLTEMLFLLKDLPNIYSAPRILRGLARPADELAS